MQTISATGHEEEYHEKPDYTIIFPGRNRSKRRRQIVYWEHENPNACMRLLQEFSVPKDDPDPKVLAWIQDAPQ